MANKFYAVKNGRETGIFESWDICKSLIDGYPNAEYKSFKTKKDAISYLGMTEKSEHTENDIPQCPHGALIAFVDGSFDVKTGFYGYGCVFLNENGEREEFNGAGSDENAKNSRNVAGELLGTMFAIKTTAARGIKKLIIYHDYTGIAMWYKKLWKAESFVAKKYLEFVEPYRHIIDVSFIKVEAHTGNTLNEAADRLAKDAIGIK